MPSASYSKAVLTGLRKHGLSPAEVAKVTGLSQSTLKLILAERATFKDSHLDRIEQATQLTAGQLAVKSVRKAPKPLSDFMDAWAELLEKKPARARVANRRSA